jgi:hypothetical protein
MERGLEFLRGQVANAVIQHGGLLRALEDHEAQAEDQRLRDLCTRYIPMMREHQRMLESYRTQIGATEGMVQKAAGVAVGIVRGLADAVQESDFARLVGDIVMARQGEDTFKTFREAGRALGIAELARIGEVGERHHDDYVKDANRLAQQMFVDNARGAEVALGSAVRSTTQPGSDL